MISKVATKVPSIEVPTQSSPIVTSSFEMAKLRILVSIQLFKIIYRQLGSVSSTIKLIKDVKQKYGKVFGEKFLTKSAKVDGRYFWRLAAPGFPSKASFDMQKYEVGRFMPGQSRRGLRSLIFAITKKCNLNCEHCFEWPNLNLSETLDVKEINNIIHKYQNFGTTQIMLSGGEPLLRFNDLRKILTEAKQGTDFWIITSGVGLSVDRARKLKNAGLTGVMVSLDHYKADKHSEFRGNPNAYNWAIQAVINANAAGLVTTLSLCVTKDMANRGDLANYMELAKDLGVSFVQLIEPRATGRYAGRDVELDNQQVKLLENLYWDYNNSQRWAAYPIVNYLGYHQRKAGCFGSGDRFFYIDTDGDAHICPYCTGKVASAREKPAEEMIDLLAQRSCHAFDGNAIF